MVDKKHTNDLGTSLETIKKFVFGDKGVGFLIGKKNFFLEGLDLGMMMSYIDKNINNLNEEIELLSELKKTLSVFSVLYCLIKLDVCSYTELFDLCGFSHKKQLSRALEFLISKGLIRSIHGTINPKILDIIDLKRWDNKKLKKFYVLNDEFKKNINSNQIQQLEKSMDRLLTVNVTDHQDYLIQKEEAFIDYKREEAKKRKRELERKKSDYTIMKDFLDGNYKIGEKFTPRQLILHMTFTNKIFNTKKKARQVIEHMTELGEFKQTYNDNEEYLEYTGRKVC